MTDTNRGTPRRTIRVPDARWDAFKALTAGRGTDVSAELNAHMQTEIDNSTQEEGADA